MKGPVRPEQARKVYGSIRFPSYILLPACRGPASEIWRLSYRRLYRQMFGCQSAFTHLFRPLRDKPAMADPGGGLVAQQAAALAPRLLYKLLHCLILCCQILQKRLLECVLIMIDTSLVPNIAGRTERADMLIADTMIGRGETQRLLREAGLTALREFSNIDQSFDIVLKEGLQKGGLGGPFIADCVQDRHISSIRIS